MIRTRMTNGGKWNWLMTSVVMAFLVLFAGVIAVAAKNQLQIETSRIDIQVLQDINRDTSRSLRRVEINLAIIMNNMGLVPVRTLETDEDNLSEKE